MTQISIKSGDRITIDNEMMVQFGRISGGCAQIEVDASGEVDVIRGIPPEPDEEALQSLLREFAQEIASSLSELDAVQSKELLGTFVSELFLSVADQMRRRERWQHQAEKISAAKRRGVRFAPAAKALPDNFQECRDAWRSGRMTLRQAAEACGMPHSSFHDAVVRSERAV